MSSIDYEKLTCDELKVQLKLHELKVSGTKRELIERLCEFDASCVSTEKDTVVSDGSNGSNVEKETCKDLREKCKLAGLKVSGTKQELLDRLRDFNEIEKTTVVETVIDNESKQVISTTRRCTIPKGLRMDIWNAFIGASVCEKYCQLCLSTQMQRDKSNWHCGHVVPEIAGGTIDFENLRPICSTCNLSMGKQHMVEFCSYYPDSIRRLELTVLAEKIKRQKR
jgi:hypothetical protein